MQYLIKDYQFYKMDEEGEEQLCNFSARITEEIRYVDGVSTQTFLKITGLKPKPQQKEGLRSDEDMEPIKLPEVTIKAEDFASLNWVLPSWGVQAVIRPSPNVKEHIRTAIQLESTPEIRTIYKHIGWTEINGQQHYLHAGGSISRTGQHKNATVQLGPELSRYDLTTEITPEQGLSATFSLLELAMPEIIWPLIAATVAPLFGPVDYAVHVAGRTGTFKSELLSLMQSHYGQAMDARHLPGSWSSTANALEAQAFLAKNAVFVIDDFIPNGTSWQIRQYQATADKIIRAQGNQAGRARLTDTSSLQSTMYPRGIILSSGEDTPEGHSVRARMLIIELSPGDVEAAALTKAQQRRNELTATTVGLIQWIARNNVTIWEQAQAYRDANLEVGHSRTPTMLGHLMASVEALLAYAEEIKALSRQKAAQYKKQAFAAIKFQGEKQQSYLEEQDPVDIWTAAIRQVFASGTGHVRSLGGGVPRNPTQLGWIEENSLGDMPTFKSRGPTIGWVNWDADELLLDVNLAFNAGKKAAGSELTLTKQTLWKRLKDAGLLARSDEARSRNTIRITAEGHPRNVIAMVLSTTLDNQDRGDAEDE